MNKRAARITKLLEPVVLIILSIVSRGRRSPPDGDDRHRPSRR